MSKNLGYIVLGAAVLGLGGYYAYTQITKPKLQELPPIVPPVPSTTTVAPKVTTTPTRNTGFAAPVVKTLSVGTKMFAGKNGANAYKSASANTSNIDKFYSAGSYLGTYLGKEGIYTKIIHEKSGLFGMSENVIIYTLTTDVTY
jgi:hypothetical protein